jgi:hypothetical protein
MGNQQSSHSRATTPTSNPQSPSSVTTASHAQKERPSHPHLPHIPHLHHAARRRESIPALSTVKSQAAPPSASFTNAESHPTSTAARPQSRGRSQTVAIAASAAIAHNLRAAQDSYKAAAPHDTMGNEQSKGPKDKGHTARDSTSTTPPTLPPATSTPEKVSAQPHTEPAPAPAHTPSPQTRPVDVPAVLRDERPSSRQNDPASSIDPADASQPEYVVSPSHFSRPPRLPLPIEEETHVPGSPILSSENYSPIDPDEVEGTLPRHASIISNTTNADDEDLGDEFKGPNTQRPTVPTLIEWEGEGERVYATGTFAGWNRKYRLHKK